MTEPLPLVDPCVSTFCGMVGTHPTMLRLFDAIRRAASLHVPVVISGATGTGKELVARALHSLSPSRRGPFCPVNVAALPEGLVESELFGNSRGAFTTAVVDRHGLIEAAEGGTLLLDEATELPRHVQAKLLRTLETGEVRRIGTAQTNIARFRLVLAVQEDPASLRDRQRWRDDFYYRVTGIVLQVPRLTERRSDIPLLVGAFAEAHELPPVSAEGLALLEAHEYRGNVRELQHLLVRAWYHATNGAITASAVRAAIQDGRGVQGDPSVCSLRDVRVQHVHEAVEACAGDVRQAAALLGLSRSQVYRIMGNVGPLK